MKKISTLIVMLSIAFSAFSQDCNIGNSDDTDPNYEGGNILPNYLLGVNFTLSQVGVLQSLNMIGNGTGANFQMAFYNDNGGVPNNLVAQTAISTVGTGINSLPVTPVELAAGDYWIMAVYDNNGSSTSHSDVNLSAASSMVYFDNLPFGNAIPPNASGFQTYTGQDFLYFAVISCGPLSVNEFEENNVSISPNPASDFIVIGNLKENTTFEIYDLTGKKLIENELGTTNNQIDISRLAVGTYLLKYGTNTMTRFVKN
ncbi:T9SS type A sorting domain-containing protein [Aequorivita lipolytica]|uniref:T9SS type A sorting domain-containing protein n=1 Tax=Aequorivita lipolytica TaxID=153267 RepID=A0A5C6YPM7_9FLAO|nr:T9SS type A sorting domain-containing protein [Aequorivita lipolytica]TXD69197.1 T9SS type A sorting domain-containing protein [Aequorivita lipolytica]SRX51217.1 hypothetical protein AEQU2_01697 [Aequorivita lipolytica]